MEREIVLSYGGGVQTVSMIVLVAMGVLPKPSRVVMANTGRERSSTWKYTREYAIPLMEKHGMKLEIAEHSLSTVDLYSHKGDLLIPAYTEKGKLPTFCSVEWKRRVVRRYLRDNGFGSERPVLMWIGMSLDEIDRMSVSDVDWAKNYYPLIFDVKKRRHECALLIERFGLPCPPKSTCWNCPHMNNEEWQQEKNEYPDDFAKAVDLDNEIREKDISNGGSGLYLHQDRIPLNQVDFSKKTQKQEQLCADFCWT